MLDIRQLILPTIIAFTAFGMTACTAEGEEELEQPIAVTTPAPAITPAPTATPVVTVTATPIPVVSATPAPIVTATPVPTVTATPAPEVSPTPVPTISATPLPTTPEATATPAPEVTPSPEATPTPAPEETPEPEKTPEPEAIPTPVSAGNCNIDMSIWGYTVGDGASRNDPSDIQDLIDNITIAGDEITWENGCPTFKVDNIASTSSGSSFARSELRELLVMYSNDEPDDTDIENQWVTSKYSDSDLNRAGGVDGRMFATLKVNTVSVDQDLDEKSDQVGRIIVGQIHGVDDEPVKIYYQKLPEHDNGSVFFTVDGSDGKPSDRVYVVGYSDKDYSRHARGSVTLANPEDGIPLGDEWSYEIELIADQLKVTIWHNGRIYTTTDSIAYTRRFSEEYDQGNAKIANDSDVDAITISDHYDSDWMYFKAGLYNQNNTGTTNPAFASVTFYVIDVEHD